MAALMASTYKAYLGVGLGPFESLTKFRIPHPARVGRRFFIQKLMPLMLNWVFNGNSSKLEGKPVCCRLSDKEIYILRLIFINIRPETYSPLIVRSSTSSSNHVCSWSRRSCMLACILCIIFQ